MVTPKTSELNRIENAVRRTICPTFSEDRGMVVEGRISLEDFETLIAAARLAVFDTDDHTGR